MRIFSRHIAVNMEKVSPNDKFLVVWHASDNVANSYIDRGFQFLIKIEFPNFRHSWKMFKSSFSNGPKDMVFFSVTSFTLNFSMLFNFYRCITAVSTCFFIGCLKFNLGHCTISTEHFYFF